VVRYVPGKRIIVMPKKIKSLLMSAKNATTLEARMKKLGIKKE
jgi:hypothetical protein